MGEKAVKHPGLKAWPVARDINNKQSRNNAGKIQQTLSRSF